MRLEIRNNQQKQEKELYLNGVFQMSWADIVDDKLIISQALDIAFDMGAQSKQMEIRRTLGL